ncbi:hypothetical protein ACEK07_12470 [Alcanivoracaceae bacterium MT1]
MPTIRSKASRVNIGVGWMLVGMAAAAFVAAVVLTLVLEPWMSWLLFAPLLLLAGAAVNFWMGRRSRLEVRPEKLVWCGPVGRRRELAWRDVQQVFLPAAGESPRLVTVMLLRDGSRVDVEALWEPRTSPLTFAVAPDHRRAQQLIFDGFRQYGEGGLA